MHFAFGSSAGTENDTCVSARIKIFIMMIRTSLTTTKTIWHKTFLGTMLMMINQKCAATNCIYIPLNLVVDPFLSVENFSQLVFS